MKIYTRKGDDGKTDLFGGPRVEKDDPQVEAYGAVDELNALFGAVRAEPLPSDIDLLIRRLQHELFGLGADLATPAAMFASEKRVAGEKRKLHIGDRHVQQLEQDIDHFDALVAPLREFILPGGVRSAALMHVARTVCRRAERRAVSLTEIHPNGVFSDAVTYLNRMGDLLFVLPRVLNSRAGCVDECWNKLSHE